MVSAIKPYPNLGEIMLDLSAMFQPPERLTVAEASEKYVWLHNPPVHDGWYGNDMAPYMVEPMNMTTSRYHKGVVFAGPAQSAKTQSLVLNTIAYTIKCDPKDTILYEKSMAAARDFSKRRLDRMHRHSKAIGAELSPGQHSDNTFDKLYKSGMMLSVSWPAINEMSGKPVPLVLLTDYDRMPSDIDGEGAPFDLGAKRTTTYRSFAMTIAESSPGYEVLDPKATLESPHQAPPTEGILALYNRGDRRRWMWQCPECREWFEPQFKYLHWLTKGADIQHTASTTRLMCPHCSCLIHPQMKHDLNLRGKWIAEGQRITKEGEIVGEAVQSHIASFWLKGPAATFTTWEELVVKFLQAEREYQRTGSQEALKATVNTDQGEPYVTRGSQTERLVEDLMNLAQSLPPKMVPKNVRALIAMIDVQKNRWEVQVHGIAPGLPYQLVVIDRFAIVKSNRVDDDNEKLWVKPASFLEDWDLVQTEVINKKYPLEDGTGEMQIALTVCDSGGKEGVTTNAYNFWRKLKARSEHHRFFLLKGVSQPNAPRVALEYPDSQRKDRWASARGEIPLLEIQTNINKDALDGMLDRTDKRKQGQASIVFADWLPREFYEELVVERRDLRGWLNPMSRRNESWDLLVYAIATCVWRGVEAVNWENPPLWLKPWEENPLVKMTLKEGQIANAPSKGYGFAQFGEILG